MENNLYEGQEIKINSFTKYFFLSISFVWSLFVVFSMGRWIVSAFFDNNIELMGKIFYTLIAVVPIAVIIFGLVLSIKLSKKGKNKKEITIKFILGILSTIIISWVAVTFVGKFLISIFYL